VSVTGLLLAAGAGSRMGLPKALKHDHNGASWLRRSVGVLLGGGCSEVYVVLGAEAERAAALLDGIDVRIVVARDWATGMSASLVAGLRALAATEAEAALVMLVDLPDVTEAVVSRLVVGVDPSSLQRAAYGGIPGHPALIGREHWAGVGAIASGDKGAQPYFLSHPHHLVECADLASGQDVDSP